jgi:hypothetical protein
MDTSGRGGQIEIQLLSEVEFLAWTSDFIDKEKL